MSEEGATQVFKPIDSQRNDRWCGRVRCSSIWWRFRLNDEYKADCIYDDANVYTARWVYSDDDRKLEDFRRKQADNLAIDGGGYLAYLATSRANLTLTVGALARLALRRDAGALSCQLAITPAMAADRN